MESLEELQARHRKEQKDLQGKITQKKKSATKKTRKGVNTECEELERQLKERQEQESAALLGNSIPDIEDNSEADESSDADITESLNQTSVSESTPSEEGQPKKKNRQKERLARRAAEQQAAVEEAKQEAAKQPDKKEVERRKILGLVKAEGLVEKSIRPDGHCLFSAVADQLTQIGVALSSEDAEMREGERYKAVRKAAAAYISTHADEFGAFVDEPLEGYVCKIRDTAEWGGHIELLALARSYNVEICVIRDTGKQVIEPGAEGKEVEKIWLAYYQHGFGLGEHYNSLRKAP